LPALGGGPIIPSPPPAEVALAFAAFPAPVRRRVESVRASIFAVARDTTGVGPLTETLKWGEPAYLTEATGSGSTIRLGWPKARRDRAAVYFNCKTTLIPSFRDMFSDAFEYMENRALLLPLDAAPDERALQLCLAAALTYRLAKRRALDSRRAPCPLPSAPP
jgi:hypothetical protein